MERDIVIVGAGATAISVFVRLVECDGIAGIRLVDPRPAGLGTAFGTTDPALLCNTSADVTSLDPEGASDLVAHLASRGWPVAPGDFVPRFLVGQYCRERYQDARRRALARGIRVEQVRARAVTVEARSAPGGRYGVVLDDGTRLGADDVLLCQGLERPNVPALVRPHLADPRLLASPYPVGRLTALPTSARVLVLGSKLSAVDAALVLCRDGRNVTLASRSSQLPAVRTRLVRPVHPRDEAPADPGGAGGAGGDATGLDAFARHVRRQPAPGAPGARARLDHEAALAAAGQVPWQDRVAEVIDRVNEVTADWSPADRAAVLARHGEPVSRYISSIPLRNARLLQHHLAKETLVLADGFPSSVTAGPGGWRVRWADGSEGHFDHIVCATGFLRPTAVVRPGEAALHLDGPGEDRGVGEAREPEVTGRLRLRLAPGGPEERIWVLGPSAHPRTAIVNYLRTAALHARDVAAQFTGPTPTSAAATEPAAPGPYPAPAPVPTAVSALQEGPTP
ncbi:FAD/NAD(P)-binding protein [Streptomyces sp. NPDC015131]|uniref:FAD/NAD(P)-binding protein n=1 Tax=Streptomyces sp. NPDC015131 TaxID=3364941 RepID=UPI0036F7D66C